MREISKIIVDSYYSRFDKKNLVEEERRNLLVRYCRKVEYYEGMGHSQETSIKKAKRFYKIR